MTPALYHAGLLFCASIALASATPIIGDESPVRLGMMVSAVVGGCWLTWRVALVVFTLRRDLKDARKEIDDLKAMQGCRRRTDSTPQP